MTPPVSKYRDLSFHVLILDAVKVIIFEKYVTLKFKIGSLGNHIVNNPNDSIWILIFFSSIHQDWKNAHILLWFI